MCRQTLPETVPRRASPHGEAPYNILKKTRTGPFFSLVLELGILRSHRSHNETLLHISCRHVREAYSVDASDSDAVLPWDVQGRSPKIHGKCSYSTQNERLERCLALKWAQRCLLIHCQQSVQKNLPSLVTDAHLRMKST